MSGLLKQEKRGLYNLPSTPDCLPQLLADKNVELFTKHHVFTKEELASRYEIKLENYVKTIGIEARTLTEMITKDFLPAVSTYAARFPKTQQQRNPLWLPLILLRKKHWLKNCPLLTLL